MLIADMEAWWSFVALFFATAALAIADCEVRVTASSLDKRRLLVAGPPGAAPLGRSRRPPPRSFPPGLESN
jgi:hypothetical protein